MYTNTLLFLPALVLGVSVPTLVTVFGAVLSLVHLWTRTSLLPELVNLSQGIVSDRGPHIIEAYTVIYPAWIFRWGYHRCSVFALARVVASLVTLLALLVSAASSIRESGG